MLHSCRDLCFIRVHVSTLRRASASRTSILQAGEPDEAPSPALDEIKLFHILGVLYYTICSIGSITIVRRRRAPGALRSQSTIQSGYERAVRRINYN